MSKKIVYLEIEEIIGYNIFAINIFQAKKADRAEVASYSRLRNIAECCEETKGDVYDKAVFLLKELIRKHPFVSGNRRTAIISVKSFLVKNKEKFEVINSPEQARVLIGIRERFYKDEELKEWLKDGKIRKFER